MKIDKIVLSNFRQYHGVNSVDLKVSANKNIVLIGGKNGYGKTNFLLSLVWCLFGEDISKIDDNYKKEIQKDGNYSKFLKSSLNWDAIKEGETSFYVEIYLSEIELPETSEIDSKKDYKCVVKRTFDLQNSTDTLEITVPGIKFPLYSDEDKINFINDYLIPLEAAKFVFFDAEKIASWAELSTKDEGSVLNDALGKILGLDVYEALKDDLKVYTDNLRREGATANVKQQIITSEKGIEINTEKIEDLEREIANIENELPKLKMEISNYERYLISFSNADSKYNVEELYKRQQFLKSKEKELELKFQDLSEIMPFIIGAGKLEQIVEHNKKQEKDSFDREKNKELSVKGNELIEKLFNSPPFPVDGDISFTKKIFYSEKTKNIIAELFGEVDTLAELNFEHDFTRADKELIDSTYEFVKKQSKEVFEYTIDEFNKTTNEIIEIEKTIRKIESDLEDEEVIEYANKKKESERKVEKLIEDKGAFQNQIEVLKKENEKISLSLHGLLKKISISEHKKKKLNTANLYINAIDEFIIEQKKNKCLQLNDILFSEMQKLMHKLSQPSSQNFIGAVRTEILPSNDGLKITLYNNEGEVRGKEALSQGEKQIYISSLIKAILSLSVQQFPIFIDTPLGRLDDGHINQILLHYYPDLADQVVIMATNNEIPPSRYKLVKNNIAQAYLLDFNNNRTTFRSGYFKGYEN